MHQKNNKRVLVLYFTQTGQLKQLVDSVTLPLKEDPEITLDICKIEPKDPFPFPWSKREFFEVFPETYLEVPSEIKPLGIDTSEKYDLIILGWQPWYLSPSLPISSFLQTSEARQIFENTPVITLTACRNMWVMGYEKLRNHLLTLNSVVYGNIILFDPASNLTSVLTIVGWLIHGKKENYKSWLPPAGVPQNEIREARRFGEIIATDLKNQDLNQTMMNLIKAGAVKIKPALMLLEIRGHKLFGIWAHYIRGKENDLTDPKTRRKRLKAFSYYLPVGIFILSPIVSLLTRVLLFFNKRKVSKQINYYLGKKEN